MKVISRRPEETEEAGYNLGRMLTKGDVVCFYGDLGSGKTTMIKGIAGALGIDKRDVTSASFTIIAEYDHGTVPFRHIDLYRLDDAHDIDNTGVRDCLDSDSVTVIEWAEKLGTSIPARAITVGIVDRGDTVREITIEGINEEDRDHL